MSMVRTVLICTLIVAIRSNVDSTAEEELNTSQAWGFSMLAGVCLIIVGIISGEVLMCIKTCISVNTFRLVLNLLYALACGTMVGDVILHALPQAFTSNQTKVGYVGLVFLLSILFYIVMDRTFKYCGVSMQRWGSLDQILPPAPGLPEQRQSEARIPKRNQLHKQPENQQRNTKQPMTLNDHWQSFAIPQVKLRDELRKIRQRQAKEKNTKKSQPYLEHQKGEQTHDNHLEIEVRGSNHNLQGQGSNKTMITHQNKIANEQSRAREKTNNQAEALRAFTTYQRRSEYKRSAKLMEEARMREEREEKSLEKQGCIERMKGKKAEGYLEIFTSFIHNFFDGFALGVGFGTRDGNEYIPILVAVYTHAIPRELGDIAILIKSGFDDCQTTTWSAIPKVMIIPGIAAGVGLQATSEAARFYILTVVAGTFLYIASDIWKNLFLTNNKWKNLAELSILVLGVGIEYLLLLVEH